MQDGAWTKIRAQARIPLPMFLKKDWFYSDVMFVYENGLMLGTSKTLFSPHGTAMRGMMATILWRMEGQPRAEGQKQLYRCGGRKVVR